jgi:alpha-amylase
MSKSICFYFQVHQPYNLRTYRFFDVGKRHFYYDEYRNRTEMRRRADRCYLPMNELLMEQIKRYGDKIKFAFYFSGIAIEQMQQYAPDALESFKELVKTGNVEVLAGTYAHSTVSLHNKEVFKKQVTEHKKLMKEIFGVTPKTFVNTELIYSNEIGADVAEMGFNLMATEGAKHVLGWKSPNYLYANSINPKLRLLLRNYKLSDAVTLNFVNNSLTTESFVEKLKECNEEVVNIFANYETFGENYDASTGIIDFMNYLPEAIFNNTDFEYAKPIEMLDKLQTMSIFDAPIPLSSMGEERDLSLWMGNDLQDDALQTLYSCANKVKRSKDEDVIRDWNALQDANNFYNLCTKYGSNSPYDYYINFMNILTDFRERING